MTTPQPNILFLFPDQHRGDWLGCASELPLRTPNLDALAARGMRFTNAYTPSPLCGPARTCIATGRSYATNPVQNHSINLELNAETFYRSLRNAGYRTGSVGKLDLAKAYHDWHRDGKRFINEWGFTDGFDSEGKYDGSSSYRRNREDPPGPYLRSLKKRGFADIYAEEHARKKAPANAYITKLPDELYGDNWVADNGLKVLKGFPQDQPWFLQVNFPGPHDPNDVTQRMHDTWKEVDFPSPHAAGDTAPEELLLAQQHYAAMIENIDSQCGRFIEMIEKRGELENTIIIYSSDHGEMLGDHDRWQKAIWYEPSTCVPFIVAGPGIKRGDISDALLSTEDLAPTVIAAAGAEPLVESDALSLWPVFSGRQETHRKHVISALTVSETCDWRMVFDGDYKLILRPAEDDILYDMTKDPKESSNTATENPVECERLKRMISGQTIHGMTSPTSNPALFDGV